MIWGSLSFIIDSVHITSPLQGDASLVDRERVIRSGREVLYICEYQGLPAPTVSWYYNGELLETERGLSVKGNEMRIDEPEIRHSGVYQCIVENIINGVRHMDTRSWILELRAPGKSDLRTFLVAINKVVKQTKMFKLCQRVQ